MFEATDDQIQLFANFTGTEIVLMPDGKFHLTDEQGFARTPLYQPDVDWNQLMEAWGKGITECGKLAVTGSFKLSLISPVTSALERCNKEDCFKALNELINHINDRKSKNESSK